MRKIATILLCGLMAAPFAKADDQSVYILNSDGLLTRDAVSDVNYITFAPESDWLSLDADVTENRDDYCDFIVSVALRSDIKSLPTGYTVGLVLSHTDTNPTINGGSCVNVVLGDTIGNYTPRLTAETEAIKKYGYWQTSVANYVRAYVTYLGKTEYSNPMIFTTPVDNGVTIYDYEWVDLQLPSGTLWANRNLGATNEADSGKYFQWACSTSLSTSESGTSENYPYWKQYETGTDYVPTKYCSSDNMTTISRSKNSADASFDYDDAVENWMCDVAEGTSYTWQRMYVPTTADFEELLNSENCRWELVTRTDSNGNMVEGYLVKSNRNNEEIFLPFADASGKGYYWTNSLNADKISSSDWTYGNSMEISESAKNLIYTRRCYALSVRGVYRPNEN